MHDLIDVYVENTLKINGLTVAASTFQEVAFTVTVTDEQLNLRILDDYACLGLGIFSADCYPQHWLSISGGSLGSSARVLYDYTSFWYVSMFNA